MNKKILAVFLTLALLMSSFAFALELESVEDAKEIAGLSEALYEKEDTDASLMSDSGIAGGIENVPKYHSTYGELIWYNDFEEDYAVPAYHKGTSASATIERDYASLALDNSPTGNGKSLKVTANYDQHSGYIASMSGFEETGATVTVLADIYMPTTTVTQSGIMVRFSAANNPYFDAKYSFAEKDTRDAWATVTYTATVPSGDTFTKVEVRNSVAKGDSYYIDNVRIYAMYTLDEDEIRLTDGNDTEVVTVEGSTYTFPKSRDAKAYHTVWTSSDGSTYSSGETVNLADIAGKAFTAGNVYVPLYDATYGELLWYNDFETSYSSPAYFADGTSASGSTDGYAGIELADNPNGSGKVLKLTSKSASNSGYIAALTGNNRLGAKVTIMADYYMASDEVETAQPNIWIRLNFATADWGFTALETVRDEWTTAVTTITCAADKGFQKAEIRDNVAIGEIFYLDNVRIYASYDPDEDEIRLVDGNKSKVVSVTDSTYTFPKSDRNGVYHTTWKASDGTVYKPGETANLADIAGKTFTALNVTVPLVDEEKGMLALFHGYEGTDYKEIEYFDSTLMTNATWSQGNGIGFNTFAHVTDAEDVNNKTLEMSIKDGVSYIISGFQYSFAGFNLVPGEFSQYLDVYNRNEGSALHRQTHYLNDYLKDNSTSMGCYKQWQDITFTPGAWTKKVPMEKLYVGKNSASATKDSYAYVFGYDLIQGHTQTPANKLLHLQYRFVDTGKTEVTVDNYTLYFYPADGLILKNGDDLVMNRGTADGKYTFPSVDTVFEGADKYAFWTDGEAVYVPGETVDVAAVAKKTFTPYAAYPETSDTIQVRLNSANESTNGIRFKAVMYNDNIRLASEYGFIVARSDVLSKLGAELTTDLDCYIKGVSYDKATGKNIVYDKDETTGDVTFTGVCVGLKIDNKLQVETELTARPYLKVAVGDKTVTVYGAKKSQSLAKAVKEIYDEAQNGDANAAAIYEANKTYIETVLTTAGLI